MRHASIPVLAAFFLALVAAAPASAQTTKPPADLAKENAELRAYVDKLEARIADLEAKLRDQQKKPGPRVEVRPFTPAPYGYQLPAPPFNLPTPTPVPAPQPKLIPPIPPNALRVIPRAGERVPEHWQRREFNGMEFYLVPLE